MYDVFRDGDDVEIGSRTPRRALNADQPTPRRALTADQRTPRGRCMQISGRLGGGIGC
jgi:hypothetical protein